MCGIAGIVGKDASSESLNLLLEKIAHRGETKYGFEVYNGEGISIGTNRLAIVDEFNGVQPFISTDGNVICISNGEIYNYCILKEQLSKKFFFKSSCDTEVILNSYLEWGENFIYKIDGMFSICIIDLENKLLIIARDHIGIKPLYYSFNNNSIYFSSEAKSFIQFYFLEEIKILHPGEMLINNQLKTYFDISSYFDISFFEKQKSYELSNKFLIKKELDNKLRSAVRKQLPVNREKVACLLSGGIDSSTILYLLNDMYCGNVEAFTFALSSSSADYMHASLLCKRYGIKLNVISPQKEELVDFYINYGVFVTETYESALIRNAVSYYFLCKGVHNHGYKFCFSGEGADEIFGGYFYFKLFNHKYRNKEIQKSLLNINKTYLQMADRASMYATVEVRVPYMDKDLIIYCSKLSDNMKIDENQDKLILRELYPDNIPDVICNRKKEGMNQGAGVGSNDPSLSLYYDGIINHYRNNDMYNKDLNIISDYIDIYKIDTSNFEEVYNFSQYVQYGYHRIKGSSNRLQLNTSFLINE